MARRPQVPESAAEAFAFAEQRILDASSNSATHLDLRIARLAEIPPSIDNLPWLESLDLQDTQVSDLALIANLIALQSLDLRGTQVSDLTPIANLTALQSLVLWDTQVSDLAPIANLTALQSLDLMKTRITDLAPIANFTALQELDLWGAQVTDLAPIANLTALQSLTLGQTQVIDLAPIAKLTTLQSLNLTGTQIADLAPIANLTALQSLNLTSTQVADLAPIANLTALQSLNFADTQVADLTPIANLTALRSLDFADTQVAHLAPIANLTALQSLDLRDTQIADLAPIANLTSLSASAVGGEKGVDWPTHSQDRVLRDLVARDRPDNTVLGINHLRRLRGLPLLWPEGYEGERELPPIDEGTGAAEIIAETPLENLPPQAAAPAVFVADGTGPIRLAPEPVSPYDPAQAELHEELVEAVSRLKGAISERAGKTDRLAGLSSDVEAFAEALGGGLQAMRPRRAWMRGNALRRIHDADLRARASHDPDDAPLPEWTAARLEVVVMGYNAFAIGDPTLCELDRQSLGPVDRAQLAASVEASETLAQASLQAPQIMEAEAAERLAENAALARVASNSTGPNADRLLTETLAAAKNAGSAILRQLILVARAGAKEGYTRWDQFAGGLAKKAGESIGSVVGPTILTFVAAHYGVLAALLPAAGATALLDLARKAAEETGKAEK